MKTQKETEKKREDFENMAEELAEGALGSTERIYTICDGSVHSVEVKVTPKQYRLLKRIKQFGYKTAFRKDKCHTTVGSAIGEAVENEKMYVRAYERKLKASKEKLRNLQNLLKSELEAERRII